MTTTSDKVVLTKTPILPSTCVICLRSADGVLEFLDFQMSLDIYGSVNICVDCIKNVSEMLEYFPRSTLDEANAVINDLEARNRKLLEENDLYRTALNALFKLRPDLNNSSVGSAKSESEGSGKDDRQTELEFDI